eukprot:359876-Chlamydomonas_euryale.AAC.6
MEYIQYQQLAILQWAGYVSQFCVDGALHLDHFGMPPSSLSSPHSRHPVVVVWGDGSDCHQHNNRYN